MFKFLKAPRKKRPPTSVTGRKFHGVSVITNGKYMCEAAFYLEGTRFLAHDAPSLPMPGCADFRNCTCVYKHFDDRRTSIRRESDDGLPIKDHPNSVREGMGRRVADV